MPKLQTLPSPHISKQSGCTTAKGNAPPVSFALPRLGVSTYVKPMGLDEYGVFPVPLVDKKRAMAWYNDSATVAAARGAMILTAHSWTSGDSVGSRLLSARKGDRLTIADTNGGVGCYQLTGSLLFGADSSAIPRATGSFLGCKLTTYAAFLECAQLINPLSAKPFVAVFMCDDYNQTTKSWDKRRLLIASPVK